MIDYLEVKPNLIFIWFAIPFVDRLWLSFILEILFVDGSGDFSVNLSSIEAAITYPGICLWLIACLATLAINVISLDNESDEFYSFVFGSKLRIYLVTIINYLLRNFFLCYQTISLSTFWDPRPSNYTISFIMTIKLVSWIWIRSCPLWHLSFWWIILISTAFLLHVRKMIKHSKIYETVVDFIVMHIGAIITSFPWRHRYVRFPLSPTTTEIALFITILIDDAGVLAA